MRTNVFSQWKKKTLKELRPKPPQADFRVECLRGPAAYECSNSLSVYFIFSRTYTIS